MCCCRCTLMYQWGPSARYWQWILGGVRSIYCRLSLSSSWVEGRFRGGELLIRPPRRLFSCAEKKGKSWQRQKRRGERDSCKRNDCFEIEKIQVGQMRWWNGEEGRHCEDWKIWACSAMWRMLYVLTQDSKERTGWRRVMCFLSGQVEFDRLTGPP